jgi:hypothetical protein
VGFVWRDGERGGQDKATEESKEESGAHCVNVSWVWWWSLVASR